MKTEPMKNSMHAETNSHFGNGFELLVRATITGKYAERLS
jgi:hypothetical protein